MIVKNSNKKALKFIKMEPIIFKGSKSAGQGRKIENDQTMQKIVERIVEVEVEVPIDRII